MTFLSNLQWRFATKNFDTSKKVSSADMHTILEAIRFAPTAYGLQLFKVYHIQNPELRLQLREKGFNQPQFTDASDLLVFVARNDAMSRIEEMLHTLSGGDAGARTAMKGYEDMMKGDLGRYSDTELMTYGSRHAYLAFGFGLAACAELQIDSCPMEGFDSAAFDQILGLPASEHAYGALTIGYRAAEPAQPKFRFSEENIVSVKA
jgi:nitroreductase / dihydropteridine reductase